MHWSLECSNCPETRDATGLPSVCPSCGDPWLVRYHLVPSPEVRAALASRPWTMWRYREWMPLVDGEDPVSLGEGMTPLLRSSRTEKRLGLRWVAYKDEGQNPCGSFKARGLSGAVTRAVRAGAESFTIPTAGNAGVALAAYGAQARRPVRVYAPTTTPPTILQQIRLTGADLQLIDGHIGDCGRMARAHADATGALDVSTLREPYRIEGKKTMGLELAEQLGWTLPDVILYPTGGGTGLIGMWKAFHEMRDAGWIGDGIPRMYSVQTEGCAPVVRAFASGAAETEAWDNPWTIASGLRVPNPLGGKIMLRILRETGGGAIAVSDEALEHAATRMATEEGIDAAPEGGAALVALEQLVSSGEIAADERVVVFNTGAGWLYRDFQGGM